MLKSFFELIQRLNGSGKLIAYHDRSDGGAFVSLCEMAFASHIGLDIKLDELHGDTLRALSTKSSARWCKYATAMCSMCCNSPRARPEERAEIATPNETGMIEILRGGEKLFSDSGVNLQRIWSETTYQMQKLRDNPACAQPGV